MVNIYVSKCEECCSTCISDDEEYCYICKINFWEDDIDGFEEKELDYGEYIDE